MSLHDDVLEEITPSAEETQRMQALARDLESRLDEHLASSGVPGRATVQGSVAKDTWLRGSTDLDCFLLLDPSVDQAGLGDIARAAGRAVLESVQQKYAQHPYVFGPFHGVTVDLVPAYAVEEPGSKMSAVDRTPFHTAWVRDHLDEAGRQQVRLLKRWCKGVGVYGAETSIGGFSGYLLEVLVAVLGGFEEVVAWLAAGPETRRIAAPGGADEVEDEVSCLVVVDPVDPARNCAAAVREDVLDRAVEAARSYATDPRREHFYPEPPRAEEAAVLRDALRQQEATWAGVALEPATDRLDVVFPQFQRAARVVAEAMERAGFPVIRVDVTEHEGHVAMQWVASAEVLPATRRQSGPPVDAGPHADRFRSKWHGHDDAAGAVFEEGGRLHVELKVRHRSAEQWLEAGLPGLLVGKHVVAAWKKGHAVFTDPAAVPSYLAPRVADVVLDRRPWQR